MHRLLPACTTPVQDGMFGQLPTRPSSTETAASPSNCLLTERNHYCAICVSNGNCELQSMAKSLVSPTPATLTPTRGWRSPSLTSASCSTHNRCNTFVRVACGSARRWRGHTSGIRLTRYQVPADQRAQPSLGESQNAPTAASACRPAPLAPLARRAWPSKKMVKRNDNISRLAVRLHGGNR